MFKHMYHECNLLSLTLRSSELVSSLGNDPIVTYTIQNNYFTIKYARAQRVTLLSY